MQWHVHRCAQATLEDFLVKNQFVRAYLCSGSVGPAVELVVFANFHVTPIILLREKALQWKCSESLACICKIKFVMTLRSNFLYLPVLGRVWLQESRRK